MNVTKGHTGKLRNVFNMNENPEHIFTTTDEDVRNILNIICKFMWVMQGHYLIKSTKEPDS